MAPRAGVIQGFLEGILEPEKSQTLLHSKWEEWWWTYDHIPRAEMLGIAEIQLKNPGP